ncbi:hypothetical protein B0H21DRAFT_843669 [Amylocystis lapponica]|nr:hypothetical protein B0H21DRAFT_843669 [Amylocystis lapponica]
MPNIPSSDQTDASSTVGSAPQLEQLPSVQPKKSKPKAGEIVLHIEDHEQRLRELEARNFHLQNALELSNIEVMAHRKTLAECEGTLMEYHKTLMDHQNALQLILARITELEQQQQRDEQMEVVSNTSHSSWILAKEEIKHVEETADALKNTSFKELVRQAYQLRMGVPNLTPEALPMWKEGDVIPLDPGTGKPFLRFRWDQKWDMAENFEAIQTLTYHIKKHGANLVPAAAQAVRVLGEAEIQDCVVRKFQAIKKALRADGRLPGAAPKKEPSGGDAVGEVKEESGKRPSKAQLLSRAKGKLQVRIRKRTNLPLDSRFRLAKYDGALNENQMSDDEDDVDGEGVFTGKYISRAPAWRSSELIEFLKEVDAAKDPAPSQKYIPRIKATETVDVPPKVANLIKNRTRRWMVDPQWLAKAENKDFDIETRIIDSGVAWGDEEEPEVRFERQKRMREEKASVQQKKRLRQMQVNDTKANKKAVKKGKKRSGKEKQPEAGPSQAGPSNHQPPSHADDGESSDGFDYGSPS